MEEQMNIEPRTASTILGNKEEKVEECNNENAIVVILVGAPGSGKSTFCERVMRISARTWARVCQDTIGKGKPGTKTQCLMSAATSLKEGKSVFIDRCNLEKEQRAEFLKLGGPRIEKHAIVLDLPAKLCISRTVKRTDHEGNLQGGKAAAVVNRMLQKKELPKLSEGFTRIMFCQNEKDVEVAIETYSGLGPLDSLPSGCVGQKTSDSKVQVGIMKFLKKVPPANTPSKSHMAEDLSCSEVSKEDQSVANTNEVISKQTGLARVVGKISKLYSTSDTCSSDDVPTLAFPSISTADFHFNLEKASDVIVEKVEEFLKKFQNFKLVLVDLSQSSKILNLVSEKAAQRNIDSSKFFTFVGDITKLYSNGGLCCNVIANAANWRLKPGGGGVNAAIHSAAGPELERATKERAASLTPGKAVVVPLPSTSPLFTREGVTHVIHVLGPNMNPQRPDCLNGDYAKGCNVLREAYSSLFEGFASIAGAKAAFMNENICKSLESQDPLSRSPVNGEQKVKRESLHQPDNNKKYKGFHGELLPEVSNSSSGQKNASSEESQSMAMKWAPWTRALHNIAMSPDRHKNDLVEICKDVVVMNDLYPKAKRHLLVLARAEGLDTLADVSQEHVPLLKTMHAIGLKYAEKFSIEDKSLVFRLGYHSVPSMQQLHLHVISQDFDSKHLKNKKHWHSFNSPFFRDSVDVIEEVGETGKATIKGDRSFLDMELRCHRCRSAHPNMPRLKYHIISCRAPFPSSLNGRLVGAPVTESSSQ